MCPFFKLDMKIFQDKGKTLLPRVDSIFLLSRVLTIIGIAWIPIFLNIPREKLTILMILAGTFIFQMLVFWYLVRSGEYDLK
ncbi:MAG: hypothetical protein NTV06_02505, partial [candidate division Zixibacteria bacterium]|nr:hypothetical protein [candidate division Zixibacteria bacterium]